MQDNKITMSKDLLQLQYVEEENASKIVGIGYHNKR
jgi:hypothetical protein